MSRWEHRPRVSAARRRLRGVALEPPQARALSLRGSEREGQRPPAALELFGVGNRSLWVPSLWVGLLVAIGLDLVVLSGFLWVKAITDSLVLLVAAAAMAVILVAEYAFLARRPAQDDDHHAPSHDAKGSHRKEEGA